MMKRLYLFYSFLLSTVMLIAVYYCFGINWEETMVCYASSIYGGMTGVPYEAWMAVSEFFIFHFPVFGYLSGLLPTVPTLGIWLLFLQVLWVALWIYLLLEVLSKPVPSLLVRLIVIALLIIAVCGTSFAYIYPSRLSILLVSGSVLAFYALFKKDSSRSTILVIAFFIGTCVRLSMSSATLLVLTGAILLEQQTIKKTLKILWVHWVIVLGLLCLSATYRYYTANKALDTEEFYEITLTKKSAIVPLCDMKTEKDSVKYRALMDFFLINDTAQMNLAFIEKVVDKENSSLNGFIAPVDLSTIKRRLNPILQDYASEILLGYLLILILGISRLPKRSIPAISIHVLGWFVILLSSFKQINDRFLVPWISMLMLTSIYFLINEVEKFKKIEQWLVITFLLIGSFFTYLYLVRVSDEEFDNNNKAVVCLHQLQQLTLHRIPIIWNYDGKYSLSGVLARNEMNVLHDCLFQIMPQFLYYHFGQERYIKKLGFSPLDWKNMGITLIRNRDNVCFVMDENLAQFLGVYYKAIYGIDFKLVKDDPQNEIAPKVFVFHLEA
jgi:hypothetical protein